MYPDAPENGIYILGDDAQVGEDAVHYLGLDDTVFEYEITNNRVDCYSIIGIAREAAATFRKPFTPPVVTETGNAEDINDYVKVDVEATDLCSRYTARLVKNIKLAPSPKWMQRRLASAGIRPINNIVDITNYVMEEKIGMSARPEYDPEAGKTFLHPGRQAEILYKDTVIGYLGEVHPDVADTYGLGERTYIAVLDLPEILPFASFDRKYEGIAKFPAVTRDISMVMPKTVLVGEVEKIIEKRGGKLLEKYNLFDIYEGAQIKEGFKSVAYTISFRAKDRTLEDKDIQPIMEKILGDLSGMGIELRS